MCRYTYRGDHFRDTKLTKKPTSYKNKMVEFTLPEKITDNPDITPDVWWSVDTAATWSDRSWGNIVFACTILSTSVTWWEADAMWVVQVQMEGEADPCWVKYRHLHPGAGAKYFAVTRETED